MIQPERIKKLNDRPVRDGTFVVYWMQQSQRGEWNHALEYAIGRANELHVPLVVFFGLTETFPDANLRHYRFMLDGLLETKGKLKKRGVRLVLRKGSPGAGIVAFAKPACLVVVDKGYLRVQKRWRKEAAERLSCRLIEVETDVVVPVETALDREAYSAAVLRPRLRRRLADFLVPLSERKLHHPSLGLRFQPEPAGDSGFGGTISVDRSVAPVSWIKAGADAAANMLNGFMAAKLDRFSDLRNDPSRDYQSQLSPYLHFGQLSPLQIALAVSKTASPAAEAFLEELIIRRELAMNFVFFNERYDSFDALPIWAKKTLTRHGRDRRPYRYSLERLEFAQTHDAYWNAAQREMLVRGKMHGYMRMYWGKKIIEWSHSPEEAYSRLLYLNNKYFIDGRDPNGYAGIAWCFGKHDRPWGEKPVFGNVRYMNDTGLTRKFDMDAYVGRIGTA